MGSVTEPRGSSLRRLALAMALIAALAAAGCSNSSSIEASSAPSCDDVLDRTIGLIRAGQTGNGHDALTASIERLRTGNCPEEYEVFADYSSTKAMVKSLGRQSCSELAEYDVTTDAIRLLRQDDLCFGWSGGDGSTAADTAPQRDDHSGWSGGSANDPAPQRNDQGGITWDEAANYLGTTQRVCGPLAGTGMDADDVFLNVGRNYPDPGRFTIVLWDVGGVDTPSVGRTVCATGRITSYRGVPQIELRSAGDIEVH